MKLDWNTVTREHAIQACELVKDGVVVARSKKNGIFVVLDSEFLPAKQVIRVAYLLANKLPLDTKLKFSSGESTVNRLRSLGFTVERR